MAEALLSRFDDIIAVVNDADMLTAADSALRPKLPQGCDVRQRLGAARRWVEPSARGRLQGPAGHAQ
ncbi:hypothetical protein [Streptomyces alboniger]|uniref:hypothetical protein n=1 Tax=Streptomyces alboniger TaxID=132473 RepID=UPI0006E458D2|nr:hypothetical protein [Streptomyces alboniger]